MKRFNHVLRLALCVSVLAVVLSVPASSPAVDPGPPGGLNVNVVNTPLPVQGTVNVGNFPASSTVTGSVSITGTPNVNVVNTSSHPVPVTGTGATGEVSVRNVDERGRNPFSALHNPNTATANCSGAGGGFQDCTFTGGFPVVPAGKRLVITDFSGQARAAGGCKIASIALGTSNEGGGSFGHPFTFAVPHPNPAVAEVADFHESILAFVEAGSSPSFEVAASCAGLSAGLQVVTISGYLVSLP